MTIEIVDTSLTYIEASRLVIGTYWSPKYNTSYGLSTETKDLSTHSRTESGNLLTKVKPKYNTMSFDLKYMTPADRTEFLNISRGSGVSKAMFISLFPGDPDPVKEQQHQIYGKLSQMSGIQHSIVDMYSTQIQFEEI